MDTIRYCPLHAAAPAHLERLERIKLHALNAEEHLRNWSDTHLSATLFRAIASLELVAQIAEADEDDSGSDVKKVVQ